MLCSCEGVVGMSREEIMRWMRENYPQYADNEELAVALYQRLVGKIHGNSDNGVMKISDIKVSGFPVRIRGVIVEKRERKYKGCAVCRKKNCKEHNAGLKTYVLTSFMIGDSSGMIWCFYGDKLDADIGDEVEVEGRSKVYRDNLEVVVKSVNVIGSEEKAEKLNEILEFIEKSVRVKEDVVRKMCRKNKVKFDDVIKNENVELGDEGWIYWVGGGDE